MELKVQRIRKKLTQSDVGCVLGISASTYAKKESGEIKITMDEFNKLCNFYGIKDTSIFFKLNVDKKATEIQLIREKKWERREGWRIY